jgi:hypothetical protein
MMNARDFVHLAREYSPIVLRCPDDQTFTRRIRWAGTSLIWRDVTGVERVAPLRLIVPAHGVPDGWRVSVEYRGGTLTEKATALTGDLIELNRVNGKGLPPLAGATLKYHAPVDLTGVEITGKLKTRPGARALDTLTEGDGITVDRQGYRIDVTLPPERLSRPFRQGFTLDVDALANGERTQLAVFDVRREPT